MEGTLDVVSAEAMQGVGSPWGAVGGQWNRIPPCASRPVPGLTVSPLPAGEAVHVLGVWQGLQPEARPGGAPQDAHRGEAVPVRREWPPRPPPLVPLAPSECQHAAVIPSVPVSWQPANSISFKTCRRPVHAPESFRGVTRAGPCEAAPAAR